MLSCKSIRRGTLCWVLLLVAFGFLLSGCAEVLPTIAPQPQVFSSGLGATRKEWEHDHKLARPFEREVDYFRLKGLLYDDGYGVTYWVDGPQETAPRYARISRIEFDTTVRDPAAMSNLARVLLPADAELIDYFSSDLALSNFTETYESQSLRGVYSPLPGLTNNVDDWYWRRVRVNYSGESPNIVIQTEMWNGIPPERLPIPVPTLPAQMTPPVPSV